MAAHPGVSAATPRPANRWSSHRAQAVLLRAVVYLAPIATSIVFVHYAGKVVPAPLSSLWLYLAWWFGLSLAATGVLVAIDRVVRRLLPLAALLHLSLVFPDEAPSRFKVAFKAGDVDRLEARIAAKEAAAAAATPAEAAERLLELVAALNIHDPLTRGHCDRVRAYAVMIGEELGLARDELDLLNWAALLHDVGKLEVPTEILAKDDRPTDEEWQALRRHPLEGETLVEPMRSWLGTWTSAVGFHHERWDGKGYPRGLAGEDIPMAGRIVAVADVFDVITSARSYKKASAAEEGRAEIARCAGTQFDPDVVRAFLNVSLGRMRFVMGPLSWLAHAPLLGRLPLTPALGTAAGVISVVATSAAAGIAGPKAPAIPVATTTPAAVHRTVADRGAVTPAHHAVVRRHATAAVRPTEHSEAAAPTPAATAPTPQPPVASPPTTHAPTAVQPPSPSAGTPAPVPTPVPPPAAADFTAGPDLVAREDDPPVSQGWATDVTGTSHFVASTSPTRIFASAPSVSVDGAISFALARDAFGQADVAVTAVGASGAGPTHMLRITVEPVNDPPSFTGGGDVTVAEDSGPETVSWASAISPGPPNESGQHVTFEVSTDNPALFLTGGEPVLAGDGRLSFTPAPLSSGNATVTVTAIDDGGTENGGDDRSTQTFHIVVAPRNHAPHVTGIGDVSVLEDAPAQSVQWVTSVDPGAPDETGQTVTLSTTSDHPELFAAQPTLSQAGVLTYTPAANAFGTATVTVTATDDGGTANGGANTSTSTFTITLRPVNDAPSFTSGGNLTVLANAGPRTLAWASAVAAGPSNESSQVLSFSTSTADPSLFVPGGAPAVAPDGTLTFTPALAASGTTTVTTTLHDDGGTDNGGDDTSATVTFTITITGVNQQPTFTPGGNVTSPEDTPVSGLAWASAISAGTNESGQTVAFTLSNDDNSLFTGQPAIDPNGRLTYTPAPDAYGTATVTVTLHDDGGTTNGGVDTSGAVTFTVTVTPVNDAPSFAGGGNVTVLEDSGVYGNTWATAVSPGPNEATQNVTFSVTNDANALFSVQPSIDAGGTLRFAPAPDAYGSATVTVRATDDGGTAGGGVDTSSPQTFTLTITPVNDAPTFLPGGDVSALEDAPAQDVPWATAVSPGPNETSQHVTFLVTNTNNGLFSAQPAIDATTGHLSFTPAPNANGSATVTVAAQDDGGTADGGVNSSAPVTFTLTVTPVNDAPTITAGPNQTAPENGGSQTVANWATLISPGPADEASQSVSFTTTTDNDSLFGTLPAVSPSGTLTYTPAANAYGTANVTVTPHDSGGTAGGGVDTGSPVTFSITVLRPPVAVNDSYSGTILTEIAGNVLSNDSDPDGVIGNDTTTLASLPSHGSVSLQSDGSFVYSPNIAYIGTDSFTYTVSSAGGSSTGLVSLTIGGANVDTKVMASANGTGTAPYALGSGTFTPTASTVYLVFVGHVAAAGESPTLNASGDLTVNGGPIATATTTSTAAPGAVMYGWVWEVDGTGSNPSSLSVSFTSSNLKKTNADVIEVVQVNSTQYPPYVGTGTVVPAGSAVVSGRTATVKLASPSSLNSEVAFLYVDGDTAGDPGWSTLGMSTFASSVRHSPNGTDGFGAVVGYAPNALASATTGTMPAPNGTAYIAISFELLK